MGLDQYAFVVPKSEKNTDFTFTGSARTITYWRKHPDLQGWMENLWVAKRTAAGNPPQPEVGGWFNGEIMFNGEPVRVTLTDLDQLETAVNRDELPETTGFFFGKSLPEDRLIDLAFIADARYAISEGFDVYYDSSW